MLPLRRRVFTLWFDETGSTRTCGFEPCLNIGPVHNVPDGFDVVSLDVLVVQVEGVLPHVQHEQWGCCYRDTVLLVIELFDDQVASDWFVSKDGPAGALDPQCCSCELCTEVVE